MLCTRPDNATEFETCHYSALLGLIPVFGTVLNIQFLVSGIIINQNIMAKKVFLSSERALSLAQIPSVSREERASTITNNPLSEKLRFIILDETSKSFPNLMRPVVDC